ncbi:GNAT family N-acetyltransferase [Roseovarius sp. MMSF_3281]|uniref:GNAT family N-acetyltransferase n=1 Tax=Roseovarius sp. MMSF_3281 TaxID=3046694 RepID=UPI00273F8AA8|nr:GNAT family N-acetyltransferase [Roseovarius sp. MMSF_3281]
MTLAVALTDDVETCLALRRAVFIDEQGVSEAEEMDGRDGQAHHILATLKGRPVGCARILTKGKTGKIGRVCVLKEGRGRGIGAALVQACVDHIATLPGLTRAELGAQIHAIGFYEGLGFAAYGPDYDDAGIPHRDMERAL